jgi:hypothetical protein
MSELFEAELETDLLEGGEVLRGRVAVNPDDGTLAKAKSLEVVALALVHGAGTTETVEVPIKRLEGPFPGRVEVAFAQQLPRGPVSWRERYVWVDWMVRATLEVPWAVDPKIDVRFLLVPRNARRLYRPAG